VFSSNLLLLEVEITPLKTKGYPLKIKEVGSEVFPTESMSL